MGTASTEPASAEQNVDEPDPALIEAAASGDQVAFATLVRVHQALVWRSFAVFRDRSLAEDMTQETFIRVFTKLYTGRCHSVPKEANDRRWSRS